MTLFTRKKKVCIFGDIYKTYSKSNQGGGETQLLLLAKVLYKLGFDITIADVRISETIVIHEGFVFSPVFKSNNISFFNKLTKRLNVSYNTLTRMNCDYYISSIMGYQQFIPLLVSKKRKAKFYYWIAADVELEGIKNRYFYWYQYQNKRINWYSILLSELTFPLVIKYADKVLSQHEYQLNRLSKRNSGILKNAIPLIASNIERSNYIVWVGSIDFVKGFQYLEQIVNGLKNCNLKIVGRIRDEHCKPLIDKLVSNRNVEYLGYLEKNEDVREIIAGSAALINTSEKEGFPITFIEAWSVNTPVVSLFVDPGGAINKNNLGFCAHGNPDDLVNYINSSVNLPFDKENKTIINYYFDNHSEKVFTENVKTLFKL